MENCGYTRYYVTCVVNIRKPFGWQSQDWDSLLKIGGVELFTKMILYYFHERLWYKSKYGIDHNKSGEI